jgi:hypothetical protein
MNDDRAKRLRFSRTNLTVQVCTNVKASENDLIGKWGIVSGPRCAQGKALYPTLEITGVEECMNNPIGFLVSCLSPLRGSPRLPAPSRVSTCESVLILLCALWFPIPALVGHFRDTPLGYIGIGGRGMASLNRLESTRLLTRW